MLFFLFSPDELRRLFERLGYDYGPDTARKNVAYYDQRTSHGSTLSFVAHAGVLARLEPESSWERFLVALESDVGDVQGGTTKEGIHMGVMSGTLDLVQRSYAGTEIRDGVLYFEPRLPAAARRACRSRCSSGDPDPRDARRRQTDAGRPSGGCAAPDSRRGRRRDPRAMCRRPVHVRVAAAPRPPSTSRPTAERRTDVDVPRSDLRCRRRAR